MTSAVEAFFTAWRISDATEHHGMVQNSQHFVEMEKNKSTRTVDCVGTGTVA